MTWPDPTVRLLLESAPKGLDTQEVARALLREAGGLITLVHFLKCLSYSTLAAVVSHL